MDPKRSSFNNAWVDRMNTNAFAALVDLGSRASVLDLHALLAPEGRWTDTVDGIPVRAPDTIHLSDPGADFVARWLMPQALGLAQPGP
jgi:hypothetical protein